MKTKMYAGLTLIQRPWQIPYFTDSKAHFFPKNCLQNSDVAYTWNYSNIKIPSHHKPRTLSSLWCIIAVCGASKLELKVIYVIGKSTIFLLVASIIKKREFKKKKRKGILTNFREPKVNSVL